MKSREELKEIARQILDCRRTDHAQIMSSLNEEELRAITPLFEEVTRETLEKDKKELERERAEFKEYLERERERDREHAKFIAETDRFIAEMDRKLSRRRKTSPTFFPFPLGEA